MRGQIRFWLEVMDTSPSDRPGDRDIHNEGIAYPLEIPDALLEQVKAIQYDLAADYIAKITLLLGLDGAQFKERVEFERLDTGPQTAH